MINKLRIRAEALKLDLTGDTTYIAQAYDALQPLLMERFRQSIKSTDPPNVLLDEDTSPMRTTMQLHNPAPPDATTKPDITVKTGPAAASDDVNHVKVAISNDVYRKIYLIGADTLERSVLAKAFDLTKIHRIHVNRSQQDRFAELLGGGKLLWRELTEKGRAAVKKAK